MSFSSPAMKRARGASQKAEQWARELECAICYERMTTRGLRAEVSPFDCGHPICRNCDHRCSQHNQNRCPTCRAPRKGWTPEEAAPVAEPGAPAQLAERGALLLGQMQVLRAPSAAPSQRRAGRRPGQPPPAPSFPREVLQLIMQRVAPRRGARGSRSAMLVSHVMPRELVDALIDHPGTSIAEWNRLPARNPGAVGEDGSLGL